LDFLSQIVAKLTLSNAGSPFALNEKKSLLGILTQFKKIAMLILLDPTCLIFFEHGKEGFFNREDDYAFKFKICKSVHSQTIQINQPTRCNNFSNLVLEVYVQLNMFQAFSRPSLGAQKLH